MLGDCEQKNKKTERNMHQYLLCKAPKQQPLGREMSFGGASPKVRWNVSIMLKVFSKDGPLSKNTHTIWEIYLNYHKL